MVSGEVFGFAMSTPLSMQEQWYEETLEYSEGPPYKTRIWTVRPDRYLKN